MFDIQKTCQYRVFNTSTKKIILHNNMEDMILLLILLELQINIKFHNVEMFVLM